MSHATCLAHKKLPSRATLLSFQPTSQTVEMENVTARQLFRLILLLLLLLLLSLSRGTLVGILVGTNDCWLHIFSANNTCIIVHPCKILSCCIWIELIHVTSCSSISVQVATFLNEWSECHVNIAYNVQRQLIVVANENEKYDVGNKLEKVLKNWY